MEDLWCALCTWTHNIRVTINYLARLTYVVGNMSLMLQQAKRIIVCFSRSQPRCVVNELINDLNVKMSVKFVFEFVFVVVFFLVNLQYSLSVLFWLLLGETNVVFVIIVFVFVVCCCHCLHICFHRNTLLPFLF